MLWADPMPRSNDAALQKGESGFNGIGVNISHDIDVSAVVDRLVGNASNFRGIGIRSEVIGDNYIHIGLDILSDVLRESSCFHVISVKQSQIAIALANSDHDFFVIVLSRMTLADSSTANVRFIHLNGASQFPLSRFFHRGPDSMAEIPCSLVAADSKRSLNLTRGDALLGFAEKQGRHQPLFKRQMRVIEDRARRHGKLIVTALAVEQLLVSLKFYSRVVAAPAMRAIRPAQAAEQFAALFGRSVAAYERC